MGDSSRFPNQTLENIAYLARSESRVRILETLAGGSYTRNEVEEATDIARTTIDRIINEFEERGWAKRTAEGGYVATPTGERVITEFEPFVETMEAIRKLGDLVAWLPTDTVPIDLRHFDDATIRRPDPAEPTSTTSYLTALLREASEFRCLVGVAPPLAFEKTMRDGVVHGDLKTEHVITYQEYYYLLENQDRLPHWREYVEAGANLYLHDGPIPCNVLVFDDTVIIGNSQAEIGDPFVEIESRNETVRAWAYDVIREYKEDAKRLEAATFR
jgi:predicted transcriptional regulator